MTDYTLSTESRKNIVRDLSCWKQELERNNSDWADDEWRAWIETLADLSDSELCHWWFTHVGEWLASHDRIYVPSTVDFDDYLEYQFGHILDGVETDYGWITSCVLPDDINYEESVPNNSA